jgi:hypothetical protein
MARRMIRHRRIEQQGKWPGKKKRQWQGNRIARNGKGMAR